MTRESDPHEPKICVYCGGFITDVNQPCSERGGEVCRGTVADFEDNSETTTEGRREALESVAERYEGETVGEIARLYSENIDESNNDRRRSLDSTKEEQLEAAKHVAEEFEGEPTGELAEILIESLEG